MADLATAWVVTQPSYFEPGLILNFSQASNAFDLTANRKPLVKLGIVDQYVYARRLEVRTRVVSNQGVGQMVPSASTIPSMINIATYRTRVRAEYDHLSVAMMGQWGASEPEAQRLAMRQGHYQWTRDALLYGVQPANGEGILNSNGATAVNLPPDSNGNTTVSTYDNGQLAVFILAQIQATKVRGNQLGTPRRFAIVGPQRVMGQMEYQGIVQLTSMQRPGGGTLSIKGTVEEVAETWNGDTIDWGYDDTLIGKGAGGTDAIVITMPEVEPRHVGEWDTNEFAKLGFT